MPYKSERLGDDQFIGGKSIHGTCLEYQCGLVRWLLSCLFDILMRVIRRSIASHSISNEPYTIRRRYLYDMAMTVICHGDFPQEGLIEFGHHPALLCR